MIPAIITRLKTLPQLKLVAGALDWAALEQPPPQHLWPACYVLPFASGAGANGLAAGGFRQRLEETVAILLVTGNLRDARGEAASTDLVAIRDTVRASLLGWSPGTAWEPLELRAGSLHAVIDGVAIWRDQLVSRTQFQRL